MAGADYRRCDKCGTKTFYDATLNYDCGKKGAWVQKEDAVIEAGATDENSGYLLDRLGDWAVLCRTCSQEFKTQIVPKEPRP